MKLKRFISLLVLSMFFSSFFTFTSFVFSEETNPLNIEKIIGVPENKGVFRMATQDGSQFFPMYQQGLVLDSKGNIYIGDSGESQIEVFDSGFKSIRNFGEIGTGNGKFQYLTAMCIDENDNIYTVDSYNAYIQIFSSDGKVIKKFGEKGEDDNKLLNPSGIAILKSGDLVITDYASGVKVFSKSGEFKQLFTDDSRIYNPTGVTVDNDGYVYITITDYQSGSSILKYSPEGEFIVTAVSAGASENKLAGFATSVCIDGNYLYVTSMGSNNVFAQKFEIEKDPKAPLKFIEIISSYPKSNVIGETDIALPTSIFAKDGLVYILDGLINRLIILDEAKNLKGSIQSPVLLYGYLYGNQKKPKGYMSNPQGVRVDSEGRIFVGDSNYHDVVVFDSEGEEINRFGKFITQRGIVPGELYNPTDIIVDPDGYVYVSDVATSVVQVFDPDFEPVMAIEEGFNNPQGLAFDSEGNLLVISSRSSIVSRIDISDVIDEEASEIDSYPLEG
ncbi:MAG: NHL repeat-containing protein [Caldisericia bacterium]|nr:NHL repeat-containing protein [Caldisericia bacterium]